MAEKTQKIQRIHNIIYNIYNSDCLIVLPARIMPRICASGDRNIQTATGAEKVHANPCDMSVLRLRSLQSYAPLHGTRNESAFA